MKKTESQPFRQRYTKPTDFALLNEERVAQEPEGKETMENIGLTAAALAIVAGAALLYRAASTHDADATFLLLGAAAALAAGTITCVLALKSKLFWRRIQRQNREEAEGCAKPSAR